MTTLAFFPQFSGWELLIIAGIALLIFGKRLPEVGRSLGKGIVEFKKGLKGVEEDINDPRNERRYDERRDLPPPNRQPLPEGAAYDDRRVSRDRYEQPVADRPAAAEPPADDRR